MLTFCSIRSCNQEGYRRRHFHQLFHHLRHRIVEKRHQRDCVDNLLNGAPQIQLLHPGQGGDPVRPRPAGLFIKETEELRLVCVWEGGRRGPGTWPCSASRAPTPRPWLSSGPVGRSGATLQPGPWRRTSAHAATWSGAVAPAAYARLPQRCQHDCSTS